MRGGRRHQRGCLLQLGRPALFLFAVLRNDNRAVGHYSDNMHTEFYLRECYENSYNKAAETRSGHFKVCHQESG